MGWSLESGGLLWDAGVLDEAQPHVYGTCQKQNNLQNEKKSHSAVSLGPMVTIGYTRLDLGWSLECLSMALCAQNDVMHKYEEEWHATCQILFRIGIPFSLFREPGLSTFPSLPLKKRI